MNRSLTPQEQAEFDAIKAEYRAAVAKKKEWLDRKMVETSNFKPGDFIFNREGRVLGLVSELYRYWDSQNRADLDNCHHAQYQYYTSKNCRDNTSRQSGVLFYSSAEIIRLHGKEVHDSMVAIYTNINPWVTEILEKVKVNAQPV
jgi:hypothetical protein